MAGTITLIKCRRVTALVDEEVNYTVDRLRYKELLAKGLREDEALEELRADSLLDIEVNIIKQDVDEVIMVHESTVEEA